MNFLASLSVFGTEQEGWQDPPKTTVRILSIDGGGLRGAIPATVLEALEVALTEDLIKVKPEPKVESITHRKKSLSVVPPESKERMTVNIDASLKKDLQLYCVHNRCQMTEVVEKLVRDFLKDKK